MRNLFVLLIIFLAAACAADAQISSSGNYTLDQSVIAAGGGTSANGNLKVEGTAGQNAAGAKQVNAPYNFYPGFWTAPLIFAPTAAEVSVGGRVVTADNSGIRNARITVTNGNGETRTVLSGAFGYFHFAEVAPGGTYIFSVHAKRYAFTESV